MALDTITLFLEQFKYLLQSDAALRDVVQKKIEERFKISIPLKSINVKAGVVTVTTTPALKNQLFIERQALLEDINKILSKPLKNIR